MTSRPILFSAPMVRALLAGTKTQTRRLVKPGPSQSFLPDGPPRNYSRTLVDVKTGEQYPDPVIRFGVSDENEDYPCDYGRPGDRLRAIQDAHWVTASQHEWVWTTEQQANMARYILWASQRIEAIQSLSSGTPLLHP